MNIEVGKKYIGKDGEVVEVENIKDNHFDNNRTSRTDCVWFWDKQGSIHVLTERDFLEQYKPYQVVYEYLYALCYEYLGISEKYYKDDTEFQAKNGMCKFFQRLDFTKRERKIML